MINFAKAKQRHSTVERAAAQDEEATRALWDALSGNLDSVPPGTYASAVADTYPPAYAAILADDTAAAFALSCMLRGYADAIGVAPLTEDASDVAGKFATHNLTPFAARSAARKGWEHFAKRVDQAAEIAVGAGWDLSASLPHVQKIPDNSERMKRLKRVAELAGRMRRSLQGARSKLTPGVAGEIAGIEQSDKIQRMTGSQMQPLAHGLAEWLVWEAYTRKGLETYKTAGPTRVGRGPLVIAVDESGSMKSGDGARNVWAKAAMLALARAAIDDNRKVAVVHFAEVTKPVYLEKGDIAGQIDALFHFFGGGTDIARAIRVAGQQVVELATKGHAGADVVLITDGEDLSWEAKQLAIDGLKTANTRLWTIAIECTLPAEDPIVKDAARYVPLSRAAMNDPAALTAVVSAL